MRVLSVHWEEIAVRQMLVKIVVLTMVLLVFGHVSAQSLKTGADQNVSVIPG
jgi:hypothetical protein